jgi:hypothetical protein
VRTGPAQLPLMSRIAGSYYLDGRSKSDIAAELNISRFRVSRLLEPSRQSGLVRIVIEHQGSIDPDLSMQLDGEQSSTEPLSCAVLAKTRFGGAARLDSHSAALRQSPADHSPTGAPMAAKFVLTKNMSGKFHFNCSRAMAVSSRPASSTTRGPQR